MYNYDETTKLYSVAGRSGLCNISNTLHLNITSCIHNPEDSTVELDLTKSELCRKALEEFVPYHTACSRPLTITETSNVVDPESDSESDPYIVESVVSKRYNPRKCQFEYLVKLFNQ